MIETSTKSIIHGERIMEPELVIIKPAELFLKSEHVMQRMMKALASNIKVALKDVVYDQIKKERLRISIYSSETEEVIKAVKNVFGIAVIFQASQVGADIKTMKNTALELAKDSGLTRKKSFAIRVNRADKKMKFSSKDLEKDIGKFVQDSTKSKVKLKDPDIQVNIELYKDKAYLYTHSVRGLGGLPEGVSGKVVCIVNKPQDKLAAWMMRRRGCEVISFNKSDIKLAEKFAEKNQAKALVLANTKITKLTSKFPVFTPLVGLDAQKINQLKKLIQ